MDRRLIVTSPAFAQEGLIPIEHTGRGADRSPELQVSGIPEGARTLAILMDDLDHPIPAYSHWVVWNLPVSPVIPAGVPYGAHVSSLGDAMQGRGYGRNRYRGPKPPFNWSHRYRYSVYALDCALELPETARKRDLLRAMRGHVLAEGALVGRFR